MTKPGRIIEDLGAGARRPWPEAYVYTATVTPAAPGTVTVTVPAGGANDAAGNSNTAATPATTTYDTTPPTVAISGVPATTNAPFTTTFTFSKPVTGITAASFGVTDGTLSNFVAVSPGVYTATVTPTSPGTVTITAPAGIGKDAAGNNNTAATPATTLFDNVAPTVVIGGVPANTNGPFTTTFTFSKPVTGLTAGGIGVANGTLSNLVATGANTYTATVTPTAAGIVTITVPGGGAHDAAGNLNTPATPASALFDNVSPTVVISGVPATTNAPFTTTFTFSKPVTGLTPGGVGVVNGTLSNLVSTGPNTYTATVTPTAPGLVTITVPAGGAHDVADNSSTAAAPASTIFDTVAPTVAISGVPANSNGPFTATFTFSKPVTGLTAGGIGVTDGTLSNLQSTGPNTYTATVTPATPGTVTVTVPAGGAQDAAGNVNTAAAPASSGLAPLWWTVWNFRL